MSSHVERLITHRGTPRLHHGPTNPGMDMVSMSKLSLRSHFSATPSNQKLRPMIFLASSPKSGDAFLKSPGVYRSMPPTPERFGRDTVQNESGEQLARRDPGDVRELFGA